MRRWLILFLAALVTACSLGGPRATQTSTGPATATRARAPASATPAADATGDAPASPAPTLAEPGTAAPATSAPSATSLRLWLPPDFAPDVNTAGGRVLADQISAFESAHRGTAIQVRLKSAAGSGGLLASLVAAANVAPSVLPHLIALRRDDLAAATAAGLVTPLSDRLPPELLADFYPFAQALGRVNGEWMGLPFAADARIMAYLTSSYPAPPLAWADLITGTVALPAGEPNALSLLTVYLALGGEVAGDDGRVALQSDPLSEALEFFQGLQTAGMLPPNALDLADAAGAWQLFRERRATVAFTSAQLFLADHFRVDGAAATLLPTRGQTPVALADGWSWALVNAHAAERDLAAQLLAWLAAPEQNSVWTEAAQVLPTRATSLTGWQAQRLIPFVSDTVSHAELQPAGATLSLVGPALRQALADVLAGRATPFAAATRAAQTVAGP
jgi:ABC-type glycerol-3-phosphate transport system substrate-binding protein